MNKRLECMTYNLFEYLNGDMDYSTFIATHPNYKRDIFINIIKESIAELMKDFDSKYNHFFFMAFVDKDKDTMLNVLEEINNINGVNADKYQLIHKKIKEINEKSFTVEGLFKNKDSRTQYHFEEESIRLFFLTSCTNMLLAFLPKGKTILADYCVDTCLKTIEVPDLFTSSMNDFDYTFLKEVYDDFNNYKKEWKVVFVTLLNDPKVRTAVDLMEGLRG